MSIIFMGFPLPYAFRPVPDSAVERTHFPASANSFARELENTVTQSCGLRQPFFII
ncbi:hypothetical protein [Caulobacter sp. BK020]|uniref:hypothetical protein n=1 Tax=Caulobacter sp. BK020 TaxID=2512117 RepID=UPI0014048646|nr:hypothetical protein [Caulobacter sp. BK020]